MTAPFYKFEHFYKSFLSLLQPSPTEKESIFFRKWIKEPFILKVAKKLSQERKQSLNKSLYQLVIAGCKAHINNQSDEEFVVIKKSSLKKLDFAIGDMMEEIKKA